MIEKLNIGYIDESIIGYKINELTDAVNSLRDDCNLLMGYIAPEDGTKPTMANNANVAENCECAKNAHKSDLEEALEGFPGLFKSNKDEPLTDALMRDVKRINQNVNFGQPEVKENFTTRPKNVQKDTESRPENVQDHKIRSTNERLRRALDYAIDVIQTVAKMADKHSRYDSFEEQLKDIQAYCWQEGYILTHEEELNRAITKGGKDE